MRRAIRIFALALVAAFLLLSAYALWMKYAWRVDYEVRESVRKAQSSSVVARWWRCRNADRPMLLELQQPWELEYSYSGGFGPIAGSMHLASTGAASVRTMRSSENDWTTRSVSLSKKQVMEIARVIDESALLCQRTEVRAGYRVLDLGRFVLKMKTAGVMRELVLDECRTVPDGAAINELLGSLRERDAALGEAFDWGPYATVSVPDICESDANKLLHTTALRNAAREQ